jgi:tetratricopeptide (TPR) repeat protein
MGESSLSRSVPAATGGQVAAERPAPTPAPPGAATLSAESTVQRSADPAEQPGSSPSAVSSSKIEAFDRAGARHWKGVAAAILTLGLLGMGTMWWLNRGPKLTESDYIVLTDFVNTTGEDVFDGTLTKAVAVKLDESPYLNAYPDEKIRETLGFMQLDEDARITRDVGREVCQRRGIRALMAGEISSLGNQYVMSVEAIDCQTGDILARQQVEAQGQDQVLAALGKAMTRMRRDLGESLASVERYDAPLEQATTRSLEAMKAFTLGVATRASEGDAAAVPHYERALELDPDFAMAHGNLGTIFTNLGGREAEANYHRTRAYELRDRVSEPERLYILAHYYTSVVEDLDKAIETYEMWSRTYPRDWTPYNNLAVTYGDMGEHEKRLEAAKKALELQPDHVLPYTNLAGAFRQLGKFEESKAVVEQALARGIDTHQFHWGLYGIGIATGDEQLMQQQAEWHRGRQSEAVHNLMAAGHAELQGRRREAHDRYDQARALAETFGMTDTVAGDPWRRAELELRMGDLERARSHVAEIVISDETPIWAVGEAARLHARVGDVQRAEELLARTVELKPGSTWVHSWEEPLTRGAIAMAQGDPQGAVEALRRVRFERSNFEVPWARGEALLAAGRSQEALVEYQKVVDWVGVGPADGRRALAHLQIGRAHVAAGDLEAARDSYLRFLELWAEADEDIPVLSKARSELEALPGGAQG